VRDGEDGDVIGSRLEKIDVGTDEDGDPMTSCVVLPVETAALQTAIGPTDQEDQRRRQGRVRGPVRGYFRSRNNTFSQLPHPAGHPDNFSCPVAPVLRDENDRRDRQAGQQAQSFCPGRAKAPKP
jgi:hypothetical protein